VGLKPGGCSKAGGKVGRRIRDEEHFGKLLRERHPAMLGERKLMDCVEEEPARSHPAMPAPPA
jgi:hypothetical protein